MAELLSQYSFVIGAVVCVLIFFGPQIWSGVKRVGSFVRKRLPSVATLKAPSGKIELTYLQFAGLLLAMFLMMGGVKGCTLPTLPGLPSFPWTLTQKVTAAVYVYEKDSGGVPPFAGSAIGKLNERGIIATTHEDDATNAAGSIPAQHKNAVPAARAAGLPAFVTSAGDRVLKTISKPATEAQMLEAVP